MPETETTTEPKVTELLRFEKWLVLALRTKHAETYAQHRLSFNRWLKAWIIESMELEEPKQ